MADLCGSWIYEGPAADRLWQKSAIGGPVGQGKLELSPVETLFVHYHRHLELPTNDWLKNSLIENSLLLQEYSILEALRVPGNKVVLSKILDSSLNKSILIRGLLDGPLILIQEIVNQFQK